MSDEKKEIRAKWRAACFARDGGCWLCQIADDGWYSAGKALPLDELEVHHITPRHLCPGGGYVVENGICLCKQHHAVVEGHVDVPGEDYAPAKLYAMISTTTEMAFAVMSGAAALLTRCHVPGGVLPRDVRIEVGNFFDKRRGRLPHGASE